MLTAVLVISFLSFIGLGLPDGLLGVAWPSVRTEFGRQMGAIAWFLAAESLGYFLSSVGSGRTVRRAGLGWTLFSGALAMAAGLLLVSLAPRWLLLVAGFALIGAGAGLIDSGFNAYAAHHFSATAMNWMHACYGIGATVGPPIVTLSMLQLGSWRWAYAGSALFLAAVSLLLLRTRRRFAEDAVVDVSKPGRSAALATPPGSTAQSTAASTPSPVRHQVLVWGGVLLFLLYAGSEVSTGQLTYSLLTEGRGMEPVTAGFWVGAFWFSLTGGRFLLGPLSQRIGSTQVLRGAFVLGVAAALLFWLNIAPGVDGLALSLIGFCMAPIFPLLVLQTPQRVGGSRAHDVIGYQMGAATLGSVLLAGGGGILADAVGLAVVAPYILLLLLLSAGLYAVLTIVQRSVVE